jgi:hypothetical protein
MTTKEQHEDERELDRMLLDIDAHLAAIRERARELDAKDKALKTEQRKLRQKIKAEEAAISELEITLGVSKP